jgi:hypothetical protein
VRGHANDLKLEIFSLFNWFVDNNTCVVFV